MQKGQGIVSAAANSQELVREGLENARMRDAAAPGALDAGYFVRCLGVQANKAEARLNRSRAGPVRFMRCKYLTESNSTYSYSAAELGLLVALVLEARQAPW